MRQAILGEQTAGETTASAFGCAQYPSRRIPFDETRRSQFPLGRRCNSGRCASAAPSFRRPNHARNLRTCCRRCTAQRGSESLDKTGELRPIVRKPGFVRKQGYKLLKTIWIGRGGGDRKFYHTTKVPQISGCNRSYPDNHYKHYKTEPIRSLSRIVAK